MALGTPVAGAAAYSAVNGTTVSPAYPAGIQSTDAVILFVGQKPGTANSGTVTTPTGWTLIESVLGAGGYGTTLGVDTGNTNLRAYRWNTPVTGQTGNLTVSINFNNVSWAFIVRIPGGGGPIGYGSGYATQTTAPTSGVAFTSTIFPTASAQPWLKAGDVAVWAMCIPTDVTTPNQFTNHTITNAGCTFNTPVELNEPDSATGNDIGGYSAYAVCTAGSYTSQPTVGVTATGTTTNVRGGILLIRARELPKIVADSGTYSLTGQDATITYTGGAVDYPIAGNSGTYALTGQSATLSIGYTLTANSGTYAVSGQAATISQGFNLAANHGTYAVSGQAATIAQGFKLTADSGSYTLTGQAATIIQGLNLEANHGAYVISGQSAEVYRNRALTANAGSYTLSGQSATLLRSKLVTANNGTYAVNGQDAALVLSHAITVDAGSYTVTGQPATLLKSKVVSAAYGTYTLTGEDATIDYIPVGGYVLDGLHGHYYVTGQSASVLKTHILSAGSGSYTVTGQAAILSHTHNLYGDYGSYAVTGQLATLQKNNVVSAGAGSYAVTGQAATVTLGKTLLANSGTYTLTGQAASVSRDFTLTANAGSYTYTGQPASIARDVALTAEYGSYSVTGQNAALRKGITLDADHGTYSIVTGYVVAGYVVAGYFVGNADILIGRLVTGNSGTYAIDGQDATITKGIPQNIVLDANGGFYTVSGQAAGIVWQTQQTPMGGGSAHPLILEPDRIDTLVRKAGVAAVGGTTLRIAVGKTRATGKISIAQSVMLSPVGVKANLSLPEARGIKNPTIDELMHMLFELA